MHLRPPEHLKLFSHSKVHGKENPDHLMGAVLEHRDSQRKAGMKETIGHQGHPGTFAPWNWERKCEYFFRRLGRWWSDVAKDK